MAVIPPLRSSPTPQIDQLWIYPVKSCKGIKLESSRVQVEGLEYDRRWMIVMDPPTGSPPEAEMKACTARQFPKMVLIGTRVEETEGRLWVMLPAPDRPDQEEGERIFWVPLNGPSAVDEVERTVDGVAPSSSQWTSHSSLNLWSLHLSGVSPPASHPSTSILSSFFGRPVRMVYKSGTPRGASKKGPRDARTAFADTYPLHVLTLPTIHSFARALALPLPPRPGVSASDPLEYDLEATIARFRPNVVVSLGPEVSEPYEEDQWGLVDVGREGEGGLEVVGRCGRCTLPNVTPGTGIKNGTPYRLLNATRPKEVDEFVGVPCPVLGVYAVPRGHDAGTLRWSVGDEVRVRTWAERDA